MKHLMVMFALFGTALMEGQTSKPISLADGSLFSARGIETKGVPELLSCCGGPVCLPGEPCGSKFVLFGAGSMERQALESVSVAGVSGPSNRAEERNSVGKLLWCCGGPVCIPNEPCGGGGSRFD